MKKYKGLLAVSVLSLGILAACGDDEEVTNAPQNAPTEQENGTTETETSADAPFSFTHFSLDVDYDGYKDFDVEYENESTGVEASYQNDLTNEKLSGNDAYTKIESVLKGFTFNVNTPDKQVIQEVKDAFKVGEDYKELEIDVRFADGGEKEYRDVK